MKDGSPGPGPTGTVTYSRGAHAGHDQVSYRKLWAFALTDHFGLTVPLRGGLYRGIVAPAGDRLFPRVLVIVRTLVSGVSPRLASLRVAGCSSASAIAVAGSSANCRGILVESRAAAVVVREEIGGER